MAEERELAAIRERVARDVRAAADDLQRLALSDTVDQMADLHGVLQRLNERLDDALMELELIEARQATEA